MQTSNRRYPAYVLGLLVLALLAATQPLASGAFLLPTQLDLLSKILDQPPHLSWLFLGLGTLALALAGAVVYISALNPYAESRPLRWVWLNAFAPLLFLALGVTANEHPDSFINIGFKTMSAWGAALLLPTLLLGVERLIVAVLQSMGNSARQRGWRRTALKFYNSSLRLRPNRPALLKLCGLLHREEDDWAQSIALLARLGPAARSEDEQVLHALEQSYRAEGYIQDALHCLLRLRQLRLDTPGLDRKILDDQIKLGDYENALKLIESGRLKQNLALLMIRQNLHLRLEHYEQALELAQRVHEQEAPPHSQTEHLLRELVALQPGAPEPRIALGDFLIARQNGASREEGALLLQSVFSEYPEQLELARKLHAFYRDQLDDARAETRARAYLETLAGAADADPELHFELARSYSDEERYAEAETVLQRLIARHPENWQAHFRMARLLFTMQRLDEAEAELEAAATFAPAEPESEAMLKHLRHDLDQRRREQRLARFEHPEAEATEQAEAGSEPADLLTAEAAARTEPDLANSLEYLNELLGLQRTDQALKLAEQLLASHQELRPEIETRIRAAADQVEQNFRLLDYLADLCLEEGRIDAALELYRRMAERSMQPEQIIREGCEKILVQAPGHVEARLELALARREQQDWQGVLDTLAPVMDGDHAGIEPADKALWVEAAFRLERYDDALRIGMQLAESLAAEPGFMLLLIDVFQAADRHQEAYDAYQRARAAAPDDPRLARLARRVTTNRRKQRLDHLNTRLNTEGLDANEHYEKAELHREMGQIGEAIIHYQRAADHEQLAVLALAKMAVSLSDKGMYDLAEEILSPLPLTRDIEVTHPELKDLFYTVARQLEKIKRPDLASKYYKRIFRVDAAFRDIVERLERLG